MRGNGFEEKATATDASNITFDYTPTASVEIKIKVTATVGGEDLMAETSHEIYIVEETVVAALPSGLMKGINYHADDATKATLVLEAPHKDFVYVTGEFNDWNLAHPDYQMKKTPDGELFWLELTGLESGMEYIFQYQVN